MLQYGPYKYEHVDCSEIETLNPFLRVVRVWGAIVQMRRSVHVVYPDVDSILRLVAGYAVLISVDDGAVMADKSVAARLLQARNLVVVLPNAKILRIRESQHPAESPAVKG